MTLVRRLAALTAGLAFAGTLVGVPVTAATATAPAPPPGPAAPPPAATATAPPAAPATPCAPSARACVDLSAKRAWLTDGAGHVTYGPVAARGGRNDAATPVGTFNVLWKDADHRSRQFNNAPMPWSVFFASGIASHGGNPAQASNGCVRLEPKAAKQFFTELREGDQVQVVG